MWLTGKALPLAKRDLGKLGITAAAQLQHPLPAPVACRVRVALRTDDDGARYNRVRSFERARAGTLPAAPDPAPGTDTPDGGAAARKADTEPEEEPETADDTAGLFDDDFAPAPGGWRDDG